jgi:hypothetical protein
VKRTYEYAFRRWVPWWKFWIRRHYVVYRVRNHSYILPGHTRRSARNFCVTMNKLGGFQ